MATRPLKAALTLDSNILVYAELEPETAKGGIARRLVERMGPQDILAVQALLEFAAVIRRVRPANLSNVSRKIELLTEVCVVAPTTKDVTVSALSLSERHRFQIWDAVIWVAARSAGATHFLSEDLQDGFTLDGMTAVNPFSRDAAALDALLGA